MKIERFFLNISLVYFYLLAPIPAADFYPYDGQLTHDVKRDRIMAIAEDFNTLYYYVNANNADASDCTGSTCPDPVVGWKTGMKYCWGGENSTKQYLLRLSEGDVAGNKNTSGSSSYDTCSAGADCSGFVSNAWTSPRRATSGFPGISDDIDWDDLRMGDALNNAGSHIRLYDYFTNNTHTAMLYESTSGSGLIWAMTHRSLSRDDNYLPIRYNNPSQYKVYVFPEPVILSIVKIGTERAQIRWDGQADLGFRLYQSTDASIWSLIREYTELVPGLRYCEISGLLPDTTYFFKMTSYNTGGIETIDSNVTSWRLDGFAPRVLLVDGADRYREQKGSPHGFLPRAGNALGAQGIGFDFCSNEAVVDEQIDLSDYPAAVWILAEESTFDETFSWAEQRHVMNFLSGGGRLFVSGSEIGWDLDYGANWITYKNGCANDALFYNFYLCADYAGDDAGTYQVQGAPGSIFNGLSFSFDDGSHGTYDVATPDQISPISTASVGMIYQGGSAGNACVYYSSPTTGTVVNMGFPFETINNESDRNSVMKAVLNYFDVPDEPPAIKTAKQTAPDSVAISWEGHASQGFRLFQKTGPGSWTLIRNEGALGSDARSATITGLVALTKYAFKLQAVNSGGAGADSDVLCASPGSTGNKILLVDGYDRWNSQNSGSNHSLMENFASALSANLKMYDSCANEAVADKTVSLLDYPIVFWMCGEESTESETFGYDEQTILQDYLKAGGYLFVSGSEIGWDLVEKGNSGNNYSNGHPNDTPFFNNYLKAGYVNDDAGTYQARGVPGTIFERLSFSFDDGSHGVYNVETPDILSAAGGSAATLYYGSSGADVAGVSYYGIVPGGSLPCKILYFGFPFETIYNAKDSANAMDLIMTFFEWLHAWSLY